MEQKNKAAVPGSSIASSKQLTCERCGNKTDAGAWIGFVYVGAECLDQDDKDTIAELEREPDTVRCPDHRNGGATRCPRGGAALQIWQRQQWGE